MAYTFRNEGDFPYFRYDTKRTQKMVHKFMGDWKYHPATIDNASFQLVRIAFKTFKHKEAEAARHCHEYCWLPVLCLKFKGALDGHLRRQLKHLW